jgi:hypothetical protein
MAKRSLFIEYFGDSPVIRLFDYLLTERDLDFSISDLARNTRVGRATLYRHWDLLIKHQILVPTRTVGKAHLYRLNTADPKIRKLIEIDDMLTLSELRKRAEKTRVKAVV